MCYHFVVCSSQNIYFYKAIKVNEPVHKQKTICIKTITHYSEISIVTIRLVG